MRRARLKLFKVFWGGQPLKDVYVVAKDFGEAVKLLKQYNIPHEAIWKVCHKVLLPLDINIEQFNKQR